MMDKRLLENWYVRNKRSVHDIAKFFRCSEGKINYWLSKYGIQKRSISDAVYAKHNPNGDPFSFRPIHTNENSFLLGLGIGLYWGEGTKRSISQVRLGNTDPYLIKAFILFLRKIYTIDESRLRFALQIFSDMDQVAEEKFWQNILQVSPKQFYKTINTRSGSIGTYREKSKHGVLTIYFNNKKLREILIREIEKMKELG